MATARRVKRLRHDAGVQAWSKNADADGVVRDAAEQQPQRVCADG